MAHETVLVIEDEPAIRDLLRLHLGLAGFTITEAADGRAGLALGRAERFDVVILDVMLPGLDGVTVCRALRAEGESRDTPILMLTARDSESDKVVGLESGADDYVAKPFGMRELLARVQALLRRHRRGSSGVTTAAPAPRINNRCTRAVCTRREDRTRRRTCLTASLPTAWRRNSSRRPAIRPAATPRRARWELPHERHSSATFVSS